MLAQLEFSIIILTFGGYALSSPDFLVKSCHFILVFAS